MLAILPVLSVSFCAAHSLMLPVRSSEARHLRPVFNRQSTLLSSRLRQEAHFQASFRFKGQPSIRSSRSTSSPMGLIRIRRTSGFLLLGLFKTPSAMDYLDTGTRHCFRV